jgi:hypothetical protein
MYAANRGDCCGLRHRRTITATTAGRFLGSAALDRAQNTRVWPDYGGTLSRQSVMGPGRSGQRDVNLLGSGQFAAGGA